MSTTPIEVAQRTRNGIASTHRTERLTRFVADLKPGDLVRVHLTNYRTPVIGRLRISTNQHLHEAMPQALYLDVPQGFIIRDREGAPGWAVRDVERWDVDHRFDAAMDQAEQWLGLREAQRIAPKSEMAALQLAMDEAKAEFVEQWLKAESPRRAS